MTIDIFVLVNLVSFPEPVYAKGLNALLVGECSIRKVRTERDLLGMPVGKSINH
jgi:hypothetical protein